MANDEYTKRINRVLNHISEHLDQSFKLNELAEIACFSEFHFHRIFKSIQKETVNNLTNRLRLEKAARLIRDSTLNTTVIAYECGFSSPSTFSRAFKNTLGCSPTQYRKEKSYLNSKICKAPFPTKEYILPMTLLEKEKAFPIEIKQLPKMQVVYIRVLNSYEGDRVIEAFKKLIDWTKSNDIFQEGILFGMSLNDPSVTPKHLCSYDVCFACNSDVEITNELSKMIIPARDYAVTRVSGDISWVATAWEYLFSGWLIESKFEPEHAPAFERFLNKEKALDWTNFDLELCLPIKRII